MRGREHPGGASDALKAKIGAVNGAALSAVVLWAGMGPVAKTALEAFPALAFTALRPAIASLLLFAYFAVRREPILLERGDWSRVVLGGAIGLALAQLFYIGGLDRTSLSHSSILVATSPLLIAFWRWGVRRQSLDGRSATGMIGGFVGVVLLVLGSGGGGESSLLGDLMSLVSALLWIGATVWPAPVIAKYGAMRASAWLLLFSAITTMLVGLSEVRGVIAEPPQLSAWLSLIYAGVFGILIGNTLWQRAVHQHGASKTMVYLYLEPVIVIALAVVFLGERLGLMQGIGAAMAMVGVMLVRK